MRVIAVGRPELPPLEMPARFKHDIAYFMTPPGERGVPALPDGRILGDARRCPAVGSTMACWCWSLRWTAKTTAEAEITEEQEKWLEWMVANNIEHVRLDV